MKHYKPTPHNVFHNAYCMAYGMAWAYGREAVKALVRSETCPPDRPQRFFRRLCSDRGHYEFVGNFDKIKTANHGKMANGSAGIVISRQLFLPPL